jgi:chemosensory pili system protein ChpA (sensor histidine kinase/response regulator)
MSAPASAMHSIDITPLSWVIEEVRQSLRRSATALAEYANNAADAAMLERAIFFLHQAHGALQIVDLEGISVITGHAERLLERYGQQPRTCTPEAARMVERVYDSLLDYLDDLLSGASNQPVKLYPHYKELLTALGEERIHPAELFFPDTSIRYSDDDSHISPSPDVLASGRAQFERGLLKLLRNNDRQTGISEMASAVKVLRQAQAEPGARSFWSVMQGMLEALRSEGLPLDLNVKRLCARMNLQMRRTIEGSGSLAERMLKDALFFVAASKNNTPETEKILQAFALEGVVPKDYETTNYGRADALAVKRCKEPLVSAKNSWDKLVAGRLPEATIFAQTCKDFVKAATVLGDNAVSETARAIEFVSSRIVSENGLPSTDLALETATALLFLENALEAFNRLDEQFPSRASLVRDRLHKALSELPLDQSVDWLAELARKTHERQTMGSLVTEIQTNLRTIEQSLDAFFRDPSKKEGLSTLNSLLAETVGALRLLDHKNASEALEFGRSIIAKFLESGYQADQRDFERVAQTFGALGFYVDALRQPDSAARPTLEFDAQEDAYVAKLVTEKRKSPAPTDLGQTQRNKYSASSGLEISPDTISPAVSMSDQHALDQLSPGLTGISGEPSLEFASRPQADSLSLDAPDSLPVLAADKDSPSVERETRTHAENSLRWFEKLESQPQDMLALSEIRRELNEVRAGAELLDDARLLNSARDALKLLESGFSSTTSSTLKNLLLSLSGQPTAPKEAPRPSESTLALAASDDDVIDAELLSIFLDEAREVFTTIDESLAESRAQPADQTHITTLRRAFHTLKGSSRMVGLRQFGEAGWAVEQVFNLWLAEERAGDDALYDLTAQARMQMAQWVEQIASGDSRAAKPEALIAAAERVKAGQGFFWEAAEPDDSAANIPLEPELELNAEDELSAPEVIEVEAIPLPTNLEDEPHVQPVLNSETRKIGDLEISAQLLDIFLAEADHCLKVLKETLQDWALTPASPPSEKMIRAVHSLSGSSATAGLSSVHDVAVFLEHQLIVLQEHPVEVTSSEFRKLDTCIERLSAMLHQFAAGVFPPIDRDAMSMIDELRVAWEMRKAIPPELNLVSTAPLLTIVNPPKSQAPVELPPVLQSAPLITEIPEQSAALEEETEAAVHDELDADLTELFLAEANDLLPQIESTLRNLVREPRNENQFGVLLRVLHTLKGSARMAGALRLGALLHNMETLAETAQGAPSSGLFEELQGRYDRAVSLFEAVANPDKAGAPAAAGGEIVTFPAGHGDDTDQIAQRAMSLTAPTGGDLAEKRQRSSALVRVRSDVLDRLVNQAGEVSIARSRLENDLSTVRGALGDLTDNVVRLRNQLREIEIAAEAQLQSRMEAQKKEQGRDFDPLEFDRFTRLQELTRMMAESVNDVAMLQQNIVRGLEGANKDLLNQGRLTRDLQQDLMRVRMVPVDSIADRLYRVVRQAAKETDKRVSLDIAGGNVELDRGVLERMIGPFEHLLRNAVVHGIELPESRLSAGKSDAGRVVLSVRQQGNEVVFEFVDDGAGLNLNRIRERAVERGLLPSLDAANDTQAAELIFTPGFSTATEVTELAGRGVGMDVVRAEASSLGGQVSIETVAGKGSTFSIRLPLTLAVTQVVLVRASGRIFALPTVLVEQVQHLRGAQLASAYNDGEIDVLGEKVSFAYLPLLLGNEEAHPTVQRYSPVIAIRSTHRRLAVHVDEVIGNREVVVKNIGPQLARMLGIAGATVLGTGEVVLIIDPTQLYGRVPSRQSRVAPLSSTGAVGEIVEGAIPAQTATAMMDTTPVIMVVDDSVTVRRVTQRMLLREGYQVVLAKDGVDALEQLQDVTPDVMLVDIEMPRMDGFDLTRNVRSDNRFKSIPIVMITSRTADKHRNYALDLGVNVYLGKPYNETELAQIIKDLLAEVRPITVN